MINTYLTNFERMNIQLLNEMFFTCLLFLSLKIDDLKDMIELEIDYQYVLCIRIYLMAETALNRDNCSFSNHHHPSYCAVRPYVYDFFLFYLLHLFACYYRESNTDALC